MADARQEGTVLQGRDDRGHEIPSLPEGAINRPRLVARVAGGFAAGPYVEILAAPGWGKTTVASQYALSRDTPVVWISCASEAPEGGGNALGSLVRAWEEGRDLDVTVVLDDAQDLLDDAAGAEALRRLVELRPVGVRVLICSTRHLGRALAGPGGEVACSLITERELRLTARDARRLQSVVSAAELLKDTGGWFAGAVLIAQGAGKGRTDPRATVRLNRLIRSAVLEQLPPQEQAFLSQTAILPTVSPGDARALVGEEADALLHSVRRRVLPLMQITDDALIYRRPLREVLLADLSLDDEELIDQLSNRHLEYLQATGRTREAVEWCVAAGDRSGAVRVVERAVAGLPNRTPTQDQIAEWLQILGPDTALGSDTIAGAAIRRLHADRRTNEAAALIRQLVADDRMDRILRTNPDLHSTVLWCLHDRPDDALTYLSEEFGSYRIDAVSYMVSVLGATVPVEPPLQASWGELAPLVHWGMIWQGRLDEVIDSATDSRSAFEDNPNVVIAALWNGMPDIARRAWERIPADRNERPQAHLAQAAFHLVNGESDDALAILEAGRAEAEQAGQASTFDVLHAYVLVRKGEASRAIPALTPRMPTIKGGGHRAVAEWARLVLGLAHLRAGDLTAAETYLVEALDGMRPAGRLLLAAATERALAEVRLRNGEPAETAVAGLSAESVRAGLSGHIGSRFWEGEVAAITPLVAAALAERSEPEPEPVVEGAPDAAVLHTFGDPTVLEIGAARNVLRRLKLVELIADMALHGGSIDRDLLQERLFPDVDRPRASNYFRQVVFKIRELIGVALRREGNVLIWPEEIPLRATDIEFEERIAGMHPDGSGPEQIRAAFDLAPALYLPASELPWVVERRNHLGLLYEKAVVTELHKAFRAGDLELIRDYGARAIAINPYAEDLYVLMIRAENEWGSVARGRAMFRAALESMKDLGIDVSDELRDAAQQLGAPLA
jgi:DNA-binding SARP family transcriptional activator